MLHVLAEVHWGPYRLDAASAQLPFSLFAQ